MRLLFSISYDGKSYAGWQRQPNALTIQEVLEQALYTITRSETPIVGCGRTDAGVHASSYYFHCDIPDDYVGIDNVVYKLNSVLPSDIVVHHVNPVDDEFSARYRATKRSYEYFLHTQHNPFIREYSYYYPQLRELPTERINGFCQFISTQNEFKPLCKSNSGVDHYKCTIYDVRFVELDGGRYKFCIQANRYLRGMIRLMVGAMLNYARQKLNMEQLSISFAEQVQLPLNWSVPGHGLFLSEVLYDPLTIQE
jgi:tRNA pseudouridine38-40 synthase